MEKFVQQLRSSIPCSHQSFLNTVIFLAHVMMKRNGDNHDCQAKQRGSTHNPVQKDDAEQNFKGAAIKYLCEGSFTSINFRTSITPL